MSLYSEYLKEVWGVNTLEGESSFATYLIDKKECIIQDMFVSSDRRNSGLCFKLADTISKIAKDQGCSVITCRTDHNLPGYNYRKNVFLAYGFKEYKKEENMTYFIKEIK